MRFAYNVDHANPIPVPPPPEPDVLLIATLPVEGKAIAGVPDLMHHKYVIRDDEHGLDRLAQLDRRLVVAAGERGRGRPRRGDREGIHARLRAAVATGDVAQSGFVDPRWEDGVRAWFTPGHGEDLSVQIAKLHPARATARPDLLAGDHDRAGARHARAGDRRRLGRPRRLRRRDADARRDSPVAANGNVVVEAAAAPARHGRRRSRARSRRRSATDRCTTSCTRR